MKTIGIITDVCHQNQQTVYSDSKESIFQLSSHLKNKGHQVAIYAAPPEQLLDIALVCDLEHVERLQQIAKRIYFWPQGICQQTYPEALLNILSGVLWLTDWQRQQWSSYSPAFTRFTRVFGHGVDPNEFGPVLPRENPHSCIYASQDARGLEILLRHWAYLKMSYPKATLDLYYGEDHWDTVSLKEREAICSKMARLKPLGVQEHPSATRHEIHRALEASSMWLCPNVSPAASCMTALKAQIAGTIPIAILPRPSAYAEVIRMGAFSENPQSYYDILSRIFFHIPNVPLSTRQQMGDFVRNELTWEKLADRFEEMTQ